MTTRSRVLQIRLYDGGWREPRDEPSQPTTANSGFWSGARSWFSSGSGRMWAALSTSGSTRRSADRRPVRRVGRRAERQPHTSTRGRTVERDARLGDGRESGGLARSSDGAASWARCGESAAPLFGQWTLWTRETGGGHLGALGGRTGRGGVRDQPAGACSV